MLKRTLPSFLCGFLFIINGYAQTHSSPDSLHYWKSSGVTELAFNQAALSNWQGGGQNTIAASGFLHAYANYDRGQHQFYNKLEAAFGVVRLGDQNQPFEKSDDGLEISSTYARDLSDSGIKSKHWSIAIGADFKTTFAPGYKYGTDASGKTVQEQLLSRFMSPGYLLVNSGLKFEIPKVLFAIFSPVAGRMTVITNDSMARVGSYGVPAGQHIRIQAGEAFTFGMKVPIMQNVLFETNLSMFGDYRHVEQQAVDWTASLTCKINSLLTANVGTHLIYDQDIAVTRANGTVGPAVQFKEVIAIGVQYKLY